MIVLKIILYLIGFTLRLTVFSFVLTIYALFGFYLWLPFFLILGTIFNFLHAVFTNNLDEIGDIPDAIKECAFDYLSIYGLMFLWLIHGGEMPFLNSFKELW